MAITHKYTLICDDVRREDNGKLILLGLYTGNIAVPQIPFSLPLLTFFTALESDRPGQWSMKFRLQNLETGKNLVEGAGGITIQQPGLIVAPIKIGGVQFQAVGAYNFILEIEESREQIITGFNVSLNIPAQQNQLGAR